jgi:hypothetical protein
LLHLQAAQAQALGRFQANDQSAHVLVRRLHARQVCSRHGAVQQALVQCSKKNCKAFLSGSPG